MAGKEDHEALLGESRRIASKSWQLVAAVTAALALTAVVITARRQTPMTRLPSRDVSAQRVFLSDVILETETSADKANFAKTFDAAGELDEKAKDLKKQADQFKGDSKDIEADTEKLKKEIEKIKEEESKARQDAVEARTVAEESRQSALDVQAEAEKKAEQLIEQARQKAEELKTKAASLDTKAGGFDKVASSKDSAAESNRKHATSLSLKATALASRAKQERKAAADSEHKAWTMTASQRTCIGLPGVKLKGYSPTSFDQIVGEHEMADDWQCNDWCLKHAECKQSVFTWETKTCELFSDATAEAELFRESWPWFNSSFCDTSDKKEAMLDMLHQVYEAKPWVPPPHNCSWGGDSCLHTGCCADVCDASWNFDTCEWFTCYKRDENWAGCKSGPPPEGWDGKKLGGHPNAEVAPAPEGQLIQGTRLYCFSVVMWNQGVAEAWQSSEAELANNWKERGLGIMQCDDYSIFDGLEGGSVHNIQSFIQAWQKVKDDGRWKQNDWSIKVDPDAVFFPEHFRRKLEWVYRTPQGSAIYMRNTFYKFQFLGALEVLTREALEIYFERGWQCEAHLGQEGGEDYWLLQCLEGLGVNFQTDVALLHDKYASDENCGDPNSVAHHFFKKTVDWDTCWTMANDVWNNEHPE